MLLNKQSIKRSDLKSNTIESIILRADISRVVEIKDYVSKILEYLLPLGYEMQEDVLTEVEFLINDPEPLISNEIIIKKSINQEEVYRFNNKDAVISISRFFVSCEIRCSSTYCFVNYIDVFCELVKKLRENYSYVHLLRLGLRKINRIVCKEESLFQCVESSLFNNFPSTRSNDGKNFSRTQSQAVDHFEMGNVSFNVNRILAEGRLVEEAIKAYQVVIDIDGYLKDQLLSQSIEAPTLKQTICDINSDIFYIYKEHLTVEFLQDLINKNQDRVVEGVNINE